MREMWVPGGWINSCAHGGWGDDAAPRVPSNEHNDGVGQAGVSILKAGAACRGHELGSSLES